MAADVAFYDNRDCLQALTGWFKDSSNQGKVGGTMVKLAEVYANFSAGELPEWTDSFRTASNCFMPAKMAYQSLNLGLSMYDWYSGKKNLTKVLYQFSVDFVGDFCRFVPIFTKAYPILKSVGRLTSFVKDADSTYKASEKAFKSYEGASSRIWVPVVDALDESHEYRKNINNEASSEFRKKMDEEVKRSYVLDLAKNIVSLVASAFALIAVAGCAYLTTTQTLYLSLASAALGLISSFYESMLTAELVAVHVNRIKS